MAVYCIYTDESCIGGGHKKMVIGGVGIEQSNQRLLDERIERWRDLANMRRELKWTKISQAKLPEYRQFVDGAFNWINRKSLAFRSATFDNSSTDYRAFHDGSFDLGLQRFNYILILNCFVERAEIGDHILLRPDVRCTNVNVHDLRKCLNAGILKRWGYQRNEVVAVEPVASHASNAIQINDILMGAVAFHSNGRHLCPSTSAAKIAVAEHIAKRSALPNLLDQTPKSMTHFGVWNVDFEKSARRKSALSPSLSARFRGLPHTR